MNLKKRKYVVYKHTSPSGKSYIGITSNIKIRFRNGRGYEKNKHFFNAINHYGWSNFSHEILYEDLDFEQACKMEESLIMSFDSSNRQKGYNISKGYWTTGLKRVPITKREKLKQEARIRRQERKEKQELKLDVVKQLILEGKTRDEIIKITNLSKTTIYRYSKIADVKVRHPLYHTEEQIEYVRSHKEMTQKQIAEALGLTLHQVQRIGCRLDTKRPRGGYREKKE